MKINVYSLTGDWSPMKHILILSLLLTTNVFAQSVSGEISIKGDSPKGVLFIFAKKFGGKMPMPLAVKKINNPKYPLKFKLSQDDAMMKQIPFKGPFIITARVSPSGNAMDKSGVEVSTQKKVVLGQKDIKLILSK
jgi:hypothetical protein